MAIPSTRYEFTTKIFGFLSSNDFIIIFTPPVCKPCNVAIVFSLISLILSFRRPIMFICCRLLLKFDTEPNNMYAPFLVFH